MSTTPTTPPAVSPAVAPTVPAAMSPVPTVGRTVHYSMLRADYHPGSPYLQNADPHVRPAIITEVQNAAIGLVNLAVFPDGANDGYQPSSIPLWRASVEYAAESTPGKWSWP